MTEPLQDERRKRWKPQWWLAGKMGSREQLRELVDRRDRELDQALAERDRLAEERDVLWQALVDIAGWENWQEPTWRTIAQAALSDYEALKEEAKGASAEAP